MKREIRILGLDACRKGEALAAVVRGGSFLDGVVRFPFYGHGADFRLAQEIKATRYYPELRVVMVHDLNGRLKPKTLERYLRLPVIVIAGRKKAGNHRMTFRSKRGRLSYWTSLFSVSTAEKILTLAWTHGNLPEPIRVAHLLGQ